MVIVPLTFRILFLTRYCVLNLTACSCWDLLIGGRAKRNLVEVIPQFKREIYFKLEIHACNNRSPIFSKRCFNINYAHTESRLALLT